MPDKQRCSTCGTMLMDDVRSGNPCPRCRCAEVNNSDEEHQRLLDDTDLYLIRQEQRRLARPLADRQKEWEDAQQDRDEL